VEEPGKIKLTIPCRLDHVHLAGHAIKGVLAETIKDSELVFLIELAVCEAVSNSMQHAHGCNADCNVEVSIFLCNSELVIEVTDTGAPFNADLLKNKQCHDPEDATCEKAAEGGRGIFLICRAMDEVKYKSFADRNILTMRKTIKPTDRDGEP